MNPECGTLYKTKGLKKKAKGLNSSKCQKKKRLEDCSRHKEL